MVWRREATGVAAHALVLRLDEQSAGLPKVCSGAALRYTEVAF